MHAAAIVASVTPGDRANLSDTGRMQDRETCVTRSDFFQSC